MKVKLITLTISDLERAAIAHAYGGKGKAPHDLIMADLRGALEDHLTDVVSVYTEYMEDRP